MKKTTRLLLVLLAFALALSCFGTAVFAGEGEPEEKNYEAILEYFENPVYYDLDMNYASAAEAGEDLAGKIADLPTIKAVNAEAGTVSFDLSKPLAFTAGGENLVAGGTYRIAFRAQIVRGSTVKPSIALQYSYLDESGIEQSESPLTIDTFSTWYNVAAVFAPAEGGYQLSLEVTDDNGDSIAVDYAAQIPGELTQMRVYLTTANKGTGTFDYIKFYCGSFERKTADFADEVDPMLIALYNDFQQTEDDELKFRILEIVNRVVSPDIHNYTPADPAALACTQAMAESVVRYYADLLIGSVAEIDAEAAYDARVALCESIALYNSAVPDDYSDDVVAAKAAYQAELASLAYLKAQSEAFIAQMTGFDIDASNYAELKACYGAASVLEFDETYAGVSAVKPTYDRLTAIYLPMVQKANTFIEQTLIAVDPTKSLGDRYVAYDLATANYFDDESCEGITEALARYASVIESLENVAVISNQFIDEVAKAESSTYYTAKVRYLDSAEEKMAIAEPTFPGVAEAIERYNALRAAIAEQKEAVDAYIAAVDAIDAETMSFMELKIAVDYALELQKTGDITGFDGVSEANIRLSAVEKIVKTPEGYSMAFVNAVSGLESAASMAERFALIRFALSVRDGVNEVFEGVTDAMSALDEAIEAYNDGVARLNEDFAETVEVALEASAAAVNRHVVVTQIVAIIKKIFEI